MSNSPPVFLRRFRDLSKVGNQDIDYGELIGMGSSDWTWTDLLQYRCVVVLGEGGCGKTYEFQHQHKQRLKSGERSFFIAMEKLHSESVENSLTNKEKEQFKRWLSAGGDATFFLDAVDELKLKDGSLSAAIKKIAEAIGERASEARFYISCRPGDWVSSIDDSGYGELDVEIIETLNHGADQPELVSMQGEEIFLSLIAPERLEMFGGGTSHVEPKQQKPKVLVVKMMQLTEASVGQFAKQHSPENTQRFLNYIDAHMLWHLYTWPGQIVEGLAWLADNGAHTVLGSVAELMEFGIQRRLEDKGNKKRETLSLEQLLDAAETLALAQVQSHTRTVVLEGVSSKSSLSASSALQSLTKKGREDLLHKPLFVPVSADEFQFYHRTVQEYLAAKKLVRLVAEGLSVPSLNELLFGEANNVKVLVQQMEPVTAWLAMWRADIFDKVVETKPQVLFHQTFPSLLTDDQKKRLVRSFLTKYCGTRTQTFRHNWLDTSRLLTPKLGKLLVSLWDYAYPGFESRQLMLSLASSTPMPEVSTLVYRAAVDPDIPDHHRVLGAQAVLRHGSDAERSKLLEEISGGELPDWLVMTLLQDLFPRHIRLEQFYNLICTLQAHGIEHLYPLSPLATRALNQTLVRLEDKVEIRNRLTKRIWEQRTSESTVYSPKSSVEHLAELLLHIGFATVPVIGSDDSPMWARSMVIGYLFDSDHVIAGSRISSHHQRKLFQERPDLREAYLKAWIDVTTEPDPSENLWDRTNPARACNLLIPILKPETDTEWLLAMLSPQSPDRYRATAFSILVCMLVPNETHELAARMQELTRDLVSGNCSSTISERMKWDPVKHTGRQRENELKHSEEHTKQDYLRGQWLAWRQSVISSPQQHFQGIESITSLAKLCALTKEYQARLSVRQSPMIQISFTSLNRCWHELLRIQFHMTKLMNTSGQTEKSCSGSCRTTKAGPL